MSFLRFEPEVLRTWLVAQPLLALFLILTVGMMLGGIRVKGIGLGSSGVLFAGLLAGVLGLRIPDGVGTLGIVLFTYCVGLAAGSNFFGALRRQGRQLALLSLLTVAAGAFATLSLAWLLRLHPALAAGLFTGAMTSTPGLAVALEALGPDGRLATIGYGIAYPFGVAGVVLFVQLLPRLLGQPLRRLGGDGHEPEIVRRVVAVTVPEFIGVPLSRLPERAGAGDFCVSRVKRGGGLVPIAPADVCAADTVIMVVAPAAQAAAVVARLGHEHLPPLRLDADHDRGGIVVTRPELLGASLAQLDPLARFGVVVTRVNRDGHALLATPDLQLEYGDLLTVVGTPPALARFAQAAGHREKALHETDLAALALGLAAGVALGLVPLGIPGGWSFRLGLAGGPLFVALLFGHWRRQGLIAGYLPRAARQMLMELGLVFCLADAGAKAGTTLLPVLREYGLPLFLGGIAVTLLPMAVAWVAARHWLRLGLLESLGGICGGMTSTPALGVLVKEADSNQPVASYAAAYPAALIMVAVCVQAIIAMLG